MGRDKTKPADSALVVALVPNRAASPPREFWLFLGVARCLPTATSAMAPLADADHCRDKARRDLLALLEGVSTTFAFRGLF